MKRLIIKHSRRGSEIPERKALRRQSSLEDYYRNAIEVPERKKDVTQVAKCHAWINATEAVELRHWTIMVARMNHARDTFAHCIDIDPDVMGGVPVVKNTRMPVSMVLANVAASMSLDTLSEDFDLDRESLVLIFQCLATVFDRPVNEHHFARRMHDLQTADKVMHSGGEDDDASLFSPLGWQVD